MPRIVITLDEQKIEDLLQSKLPPKEGSQKDSEESLPEQAVLIMFRHVFSVACEKTLEVLIPELGYEEKDFELKCQFVGAFDVNCPPWSVDIWATDRVAWYESEEAKSSSDLETREAKQKRIVGNILKALQDHSLGVFEVEWSSYVWLHLSGGVFAEA